MGSGKGMGRNVFTNGIQTWYEYIQTLPPSKLAIFLRKALAHNQGCPPASLMQVLTMCEKSSCDECWWTWLESPRQDTDADKPDVKRCWECRWGARYKLGRHPAVGCLNPRFNGAVMEPDEYCSDFDTRYQSPEEREKDTALVPLLPPTEMNAEEFRQEMKKQYEIKQLEREIERRRQGGEHETPSEHQEDYEPQPDSEQGQD